MNRFIFVLKIVSFFIIFSIVSLSLVLFLFYLSNLPQQYSIRFLEYYAKTNFNTTLKIRDISGNIFSNFSLIDVESTTSSSTKDKLFEIKKLTLHYNPFKAITNYNNIIKSIDFIGIDNMTYFLTRSTSGNFEIIAKNNKEQSSNLTSLNLNQKIILKNSNIIYTDKKGWQKDPIKSPFNTIISNINGNLSFNNTSKGDIELNGILNESNQAIKLNGFIDIIKQAYNISFASKKLNLTRWANYILSENMMILKGDHVDLEGYLKSNPHKTTSKNNLPFLFSINLFPSNASLKLPFLNDKISDINGKIRILNSEITPYTLLNYDNSLNKKEQLNILNELNEKNILNNNKITAKSITNLNQYKDKKFSKTTIKNILTNQPTQIQLFNTKGKLNSITFKSDGIINLNNNSLHLSIHSTPFESQLLENIVPELQPLAMQKHITVNMIVKNTLTNPITTGDLTSKSLTVLGFKFSDITSKFKLTNQAFKLKINNSKFNKGLVKGEINTIFQKNKTLIEGNLFGSKLNTKDSLPLKNIQVTGNFDVNLSLTGDSNKLTTEINIVSNSTKIYNQLINRLQTSLISTKEQNKLQETAIYINESMQPILVNNETYPDSITVDILGTNIPILDIEKNQNEVTGNMTLKSMLSIPKTNNELNLNALISTFNVNLSSGQFLGSNYDFASIKGSSEKNIISINLNVQKDNSSINTSGKFRPTSPIALICDITEFPIENLPAISELLPNNLMPFTGLLNANLLLSDNLKNNASFLKNINLDGSIKISNGSIAEEKFDILSSEFIFNEKGTKIQSFNISDKTSNISIKGTLFSNNNLDITFLNGSKIKLDQLTRLVNVNLNTKGVMNFSGKLRGSLSNPDLNVNFNSKKILIDKINLEKTLGNFNFSKDLLTLKKTNLFTLNGNTEIDGTINLDSIKQFDKIFDLNFKFNKISLDHIQKAFLIPSTLTLNQTDRSILVSQQEKVIPSISLESPYQNKTTETLFSNINHEHSLGYIHQLNRLLTIKESVLESNFKILNGDISGELKIKLEKNKIPNIYSNLLLSNLKSDLISAKNILIKSFPQKNELIYSLELNDGVLNNNKLTQFKLDGTIAKNFNLNINSNKLTTQSIKATNFITGFINLPILSNTTQKHPINLKISLKENELDIFSLFTTEIDNISHKEELKFSVKGELENPIINTIQSKEDTINITLPNSNSFSKELELQKLNLDINDNTLLIDKLNLALIKQPNNSDDKEFMLVNGLIKITELNLKELNQLIVTSDLAIKNEVVNLNITDFIDSDVSVETLNINGPFTIPFNDLAQQKIIHKIENNTFDYPALSGTIKLNNSVISIINKPSPPPIPIKYDLSIFIESNNEINTRLFGNDLVGISTDINLNEQDDPLLLSGTSFYPQITSRLFIQDANLSLLNREFELLTETEQTIFTPSSELDLSENLIEFETFITNQNKNEINPKLNLKAISTPILINSQTEETASTETTTEENIQNNTTPEYYFIVMKINGSILELEEINFDVFKSDIKNPNSNNQVKYIDSFSINNTSIQNQTSLQEENTNTLLEILYPSLYSTNSEGKFVDSLTEIGKTQVNTLLRRNIIRPIERSLSKLSGFDDFKINHNLSDLLENNTEDQFIGVNIMKKLIKDKLIIRLKTNLELTNESNNKSNNTIELPEIELTYFVLDNKNLSFNIATIKDDSSNTGEQHLKTSLRYRYEY